MGGRANETVGGRARREGYLGLRLIHKATDTLLIVAVATSKVIVAIVCQYNEHRVRWIARGRYLVNIIGRVARIAVKPAHCLRGNGN